MRLQLILRKYDDLASTSNGIIDFLPALPAPFQIVLQTKRAHQGEH